MNGLGHFNQSPSWSSTVLVFTEDLVFGGRKPVPLRCTGQPRNLISSQDFAIPKVSSISSSENLTSPAQELLQVSFTEDSALAVCYEHKPQVPNGRLKKHWMREGHAAHSAAHPVCSPSWSSWEAGNGTNWSRPCWQTSSRHAKLTSLPGWGYKY